MMIKIDWQSGVPIYDQIVSGFIRLRAIGALQAGDKLPSVRSMAVKLGVNPNTVQKAYIILENKTGAQSGLFTAVSSEIHEIDLAYLRCSVMIHSHPPSISI